MNHCVTCKHWQSPTAQQFRGICLRSRGPEGPHTLQRLPQKMLASQAGELETLPYFGCTEWEEK